MGVNVSEFSSELNGLQKVIEDAVADVIKDSIMAGYENSLRPKSQGGAPKLTGWLRSNIFISLNTPIEDTVGSKKSVSTSKRDGLANSFRSETSERILKANRIFITYTVPYAALVNDGDSNRRGQKFVERSINDIEQALAAKARYTYG